MSGTPAYPKTRTLVAMVLLIVASVIGGAIGVYMSQHHEVQLYGGEEHQFELIGCEESAGVSCDVVNTSEWSEVFGVPTFTWAVPTYLLVVVLAVLVLRGRRQHLWSIMLVGAAASAFSAWLFYISKFELGTVCLWCIRLYVINLSIPVLGAVAGGVKAPKLSTRDVRVVVGVFVGLALVSVGTQKAYRSSLLGDAPQVAALEDPVAADPSDHRDPEGTLTAFEVPVKTEDGNEAMLQVRATDAWKGTLGAPVTVVEFADLECGYCKRASGQLRRLVDAYGDRVLFVFKHFPMDPGCNPGVKNRKHRRACNAAIASVCAQEQGKFWAFHDVAFKNQHKLDIDDLMRYRDEVGLDRAAFDRCVSSQKAKERVVEAGRDGKAVDVHGTPRIFINGKLYRSGSSAEQMARAIEVALGANAADAALNAVKLREVRTPVPPIPEDVPPMRDIRYGEVSVRIDTFEAGLEDGAAVAGKHVIPATRMSWFAARDACDKAGKRLCTEREWVSVCQGMAAVDDDGDGQFADDMIEGNTYPYGDYHERNRCWDARNPRTERPVYTGELPGCASEGGVYDMTGNIEEWVGATPETAVLLGGAYDTSKDHARCYRRNDTYGPGYANRRTGFRCCAK